MELPSPWLESFDLAEGRSDVFGGTGRFPSGRSWAREQPTHLESGQLRLFGIQCGYWILAKRV